MSTLSQRERARLKSKEEDRKSAERIAKTRARATVQASQKPFRHMRLGAPRVSAKERLMEEQTRQLQLANDRHTPLRGPEGEMLQSLAGNAASLNRLQDNIRWRDRQHQVHRQNLEMKTTPSFSDLVNKQQLEHQRWLDREEERRRSWDWTTAKKHRQKMALMDNDAENKKALMAHRGRLKENAASNQSQGLNMQKEYLDFIKELMRKDPLIDIDEAKEKADRLFYGRGQSLKPSPFMVVK